MGVYVVYNVCLVTCTPSDAQRPPPTPVHSRTDVRAYVLVCVYTAYTRILRACSLTQAELKTRIRLPAKRAKKKRSSITFLTGKLT